MCPAVTRPALLRIATHHHGRQDEYGQGMGVRWQQCCQMAGFLSHSLPPESVRASETKDRHLATLDGSERTTRSGLLLRDLTT